MLGALGLDAVKVSWTGAAPTPEETMRFFEKLGIPIMEGYGMTENTAVGCFNNAPNRQLGSVGRPILSGSTRIVAETGEIVHRHRALMMGYMHNPDKTRETINEDGWLHTGDIGTFDSGIDGFYKITGRIKELIITAGGENVPPVMIEASLKELLPPVSNVVVIGDRQKMLVALFTLKEKPNATGGFTGELDGEAVGVDASAQTVGAAKGSAPWKALIDGAVSEYNTKHATSRAQSIRSWAILDGDFSPVGADSELTPTLKLKRDVVHKKYGAVIKGLYGADFEPVPWAPASKL